MPVKRARRLADVPGAILRLLVVSTGQRHCAGVDLSSGALRRAWCGEPVDQRLRPYDVVSVTVTADQDLVPDPTEPEAVPVAAPPSLLGHLAGKRAQRLLRPLLHPQQEPLLGFHGNSIPFWERRPDGPSIALVQPQGPLVVGLEDAHLWCRFNWQGHEHALACLDPRLAASFGRTGRRFALLHDGTLLVVALTAPMGGLCHKVVESVVPRR
ncbi:MAG TPA: hypothetical protein VED59_05630 [Acidimicrobiales bacterium]|nr:hypothetical protein [Acidimicrobiales bacterium]